MKRLRAVTTSAQRLATDPVSPAPAVPSITLLVADADNRTVRAIQRRLQAGGYGVVAANSGEQVFRALHEKNPSAVILGDTLRDTDGKTICRRIKIDSTAIYVPVILIADHDQDGDWNEDFSPSAPDATLCKPVDGGELLEWLHLLLGFKRQFDYRMKKLVTQVQTAELVKSDIINNVSHEIATPLLQVKSAVSLLADDIARKGSREQARVASMATQAVGRLEDVVNNIRQLARAHNIELGPVVFDEAVDLAIRHVERSWTWRGARGRIRKRVDEDLPLVVGDKRALGHLLQLLLDNALKFSPANAPVYIIASRLSEDSVWVGVQDFGIGIPEDEHDRVFEVFYQVNSSSTRPQGGTGTGLALAMLLAQGMGSTIHLDSTPGEGSTFSFTLPVTSLDDPY
jgi:signal transduction histidine kinase